MKNYGYIQGFNLEDKAGIRKIDFIAKRVENDGSIIVRMTEKSEAYHAFVVTEEAIRGFYYEHPIKGRYALPAVINAFCTKVIDFCCRSFGDTLILRNRTKEIITGVYAEKDEDPISHENIWIFSGHSEDGDTINYAYGDEIRWCAFMEAFRMALIDGSRGGHYEWLYRAICFAA